MHRLKAALASRRARSKKEDAPARRFCARCSEINFLDFFESVRETMDLGPPSRWTPRDCEFCEFLSLCLSRLASCSLSEHCVLNKKLWWLPLPPSNIPLKDLGVVDQAFGPIGTGKGYSYHSIRNCKAIVVIARTPVELLPDTITPPKIDFSIVQAWLRADITSASVTTELFSSRRSSLLRNITSTGTVTLRVIDCTSRKVMELPPNSEYITLSYVWGSPTEQQAADVNVKSSETQNSASIPVSVPATINDSMTACLRMGYNYLWVDKYCIPQDDPEESQAQIQQMDRIYQQSTLTLIACAGQGPQYGLPGVSRARKQEPSIFMSGAGFLSVPPRVNVIKSSMWAGRGWTYQETLLSQRRLYFTDQQLYFESENSVQCECVSLAGQNRPITDSDWIFSQGTWSSRPMDVYMCIEGFTHRSLSYLSDTVDAVRGILAVFDGKFQVYHLTGMPFMGVQHHTGSEEFPNTLPALQHSLFFRVEVDAARCDAFPSWSWAGWTGHRGWDFRTPIMAADYDLCVAVELPHERFLSWQEYQRDYHIHKKHDIRYIHVQGYILPLQGEVQRAAVVALKSSSNNCHLANGVHLSLHGIFGPSYEDKIAQDGSTELLMLRFSSKVRDRMGESQYVPHLLLHKVSTHWERLISFVGVYRRDGKDLRPEFWPGTFQTIRMG